MNLDKDPMETELAALISAADTNQGHHVLWVGTDGGVHLAAVPFGITTPAWFVQNGHRPRFRLETFLHKSGRVGPAAASDARWVRRLFEALMDAWAKHVQGHVDLPGLPRHAARAR